MTSAAAGSLSGAEPITDFVKLPFLYGWVSVLKFTKSSGRLYFLFKVVPVCVGKVQENCFGIKKNFQPKHP